MTRAHITIATKLDIATAVMGEKGNLDMVGRLGVGGVTWEEGEYMDYATIAKAGGRKGESSCLVQLTPIRL